jgi:cell division protein FtsB
MPATPPIVRPRVSRPDSPEPLRRRRTLPGNSSPLWRRALNYLLIFAVVVLFVDALVGERGLLATTRAQRTADELTGHVDQLREENRHLRETARRLKEDATTIESVAREELGLIRPGEILVVVKDLKPTTK